MPAHASNGSFVTAHAIGVACPQPPNPPSSSGHDADLACECAHTSVDECMMSPPASDNTALGMSMLQEESMYASPPPSRDTDHAGGDKEKRDVVMGEQLCTTIVGHKENDDAVADECQTEQAPLKEFSSEPLTTKTLSRKIGQPSQLRTPSPTISASSARSVVARKHPQAYASPLDSMLTRSPDVNAWDFSKRPMRTRYPSALFQANSKFVGTQQSDRQIYKVEVTILTVDMEQCTTSGYLQICDLTLDHPTLTTFFTGEIIGGPDQRHSFRTKNSEWGASDKTDMTHWARFPAWRPLSAQAKQNLNFLHPSDQSPWWQQDNIFMRWKEHFLVPDHKLKSIQGASFEGFYYICLNQVEGRISGIYFHSKSEK